MLHNEPMIQVMHSALLAKDIESDVANVTQL